VQVEGGLRTRVCYLALDFVLDESDTPLLMWPHELRTLDVKADGAYTFAPAPGFTGPVPPIMRTVTSSDGQSKEVPLSVNVSPLLRVGDTTVSSVNSGSPITAKLLNSTSVPPGKTAAVTSFTLPGGATYPVGPTPVTVTDPLTNKVGGTVTVAADGTAVFRPAAGFTGGKFQHPVYHSRGAVGGAGKSHARWRCSLNGHHPTSPDKHQVEGLGGEVHPEPGRLGGPIGKPHAPIRR
jgi:hypothetical protein